MSYNRSFNFFEQKKKGKKYELNHKEKKMLHNHGSLDNPILFKFRGRWRECSCLGR